MSGALLVAVLRNPAEAGDLVPAEWNALIAAARAERLIGTLAVLFQDIAVPASVSPILTDARGEVEREKRQALWEADRAAAAMASCGVPVILLKGTAYAAAGLRAGEGRFIGDLDILVPRDRLADVEAAILGAGWEWVKPDPYDDDYYRRWMHELPPMIHKERDRMIDIHHTVLPLTARQTPDAAAMIANAIAIGHGLHILSSEDRICHAAAHLIADGDLAGGLRNLWDIHCLCGEAAAVDADFFLSLFERAAAHGLTDPVWRALRLAHRLYATPVTAYRSPISVDYSLRRSDRFFIARLLARDGWGRESRKLLRFAFFVRSHWLRMPPMMLARHLWTKWRKGHRPA
ncbi:nucleotidyltransferase family protein [Sphingobium phenoxybenzoativorans]|uniref:Nucleotidyltransferase family protein n=1 Tax=Sphingobium phenoxybenzoativorans TaxID=1592790 RepID=A0A975K8Z1_9SPHN|nr:nucleotidyltransferase family protein [Sphingobium phenoxybenzoativorans]QUT07011.1 nucleotidyltransferase family protein [Sphingobium phenoxybenzoativorans]